MAALPALHYFRLLACDPINFDVFSWTDWDMRNPSGSKMQNSSPHSVHDQESEVGIVSKVPELTIVF